MTEFNRNNPLFERTNVPCELLVSSSPNNNGNNYSNTFKNNISFFTLRILKGTRSLKSNTKNDKNYEVEHVIRFELSNESCHTVNDTTIKTVSCRKDFSVRKPSFQAEQRHISTVPGPPIMMQQNRIYDQKEAQQQNDHVCNNEISLPIRLYELEVGESDFGDLRRDQALLVDFSDFVQSFIALLSYCDLGACNYDEFGNGRNKHSYSTPESSSFIDSLPPFTPRSSSSNPPAPFKCRIEDMAATSSAGYHTAKLQNETIARFSIVESNQFRELTHLSLTLKCGTDSTMKNYLSTRLRQCINQSISLKHELEQQILRAKAAEMSCQKSVQQYNDLSIQAETEKRELKIVTGEKYEHDRCRLEMEYKKLLTQKEEYVNKLVQDCESKLQKNDTNYQSLENKYQTLQEKYNAACNEKNKLQNDIASRENLIQKQNLEMKEAKEQFILMEKEKKEMEQTLHKTQMHVASLENSNQTQCLALQQVERAYKSTQEKLLETQHTIDIQRQEIAKLNTLMKERETDLSKSKTLLDKFQKNRNEMKVKMEKRSELLRKQEEILLKKENELNVARNTLEKLQTNYQTLESDKERIGNELKIANEKLLESSQLLEKNHQVITFLNKEINETKLVGKIPTAGSFSSTSSSAGYIYHRKKDYKDFTSTASLTTLPTSTTGKDFTTSSIPISTISSNKYLNPSTSSYTVTPEIPFGTNYSSQGNAYTPHRHSKFPFTPMKPYDTPLQQTTHHVSWSSNTVSSVANNKSKLNSAERIAKDETS